MEGEVRENLRPNRGNWRYELAPPEMGLLDTESVRKLAEMREKHQ